MQDKQITNTHHKRSQALSPRELHLLTKIKRQLPMAHGPSPEEIEQLIITIPICREAAIQLVAEQFVTAMKWHLLRIATIFYQRAEQEEIGEEERDETLRDVEAEMYFFMGLTQKLTANTPEALARLSEITASILDLSQCRNAEEAQSWLYNLPVVYQESLEREHLVQL